MEVTASPRSVQGTGASRRLRQSGKVPAIVYGADKPAEVVELNHNALLLQLKQESFHASILTMTLDGKKERVLLRDVQMHPFKKQVLHVDFQRVSANQKIHIEVPLHFINAEIAPGVKLSGGIVNHVMNEVEISCLPDDLPEFIEVDLSGLELGHSVHLSDLKLPQGVESVQLVREEDAVVATVQVPKAIEVEEPEAAAVPAEGEAAAAVAGAAPALGAAAPAAGAAPAAAAAPAEGAKKASAAEGAKK
ncbi:MAG: 50S ribosomal protein L25/general stress protein Ctc [Burkholderiales bacterium]